MKSAQIKDIIEKKFPDTVIRSPRERRVMVHIPRERLIEVLGYLRDLGATHVSTITVLDRIGENVFEILYHLYWENNEITVRTEIPRENPVVPTVTTILPGALTYEREIKDMFGIRVEDIPNPKRILLSDSWPEGDYPLRKDYVVK